MHGDTAATRNKTNDAIRGRRLATTSEHGEQPIHSDDQHFALLPGAGRRCDGCTNRDCWLRQGRRLTQSVLHLARADLASPDHDQKLIELRMAKPLRELLQGYRRHTRALEQLLDGLATAREIDLEVLAIEPLPYFGTRPLAVNEAQFWIEPVPAGPAGLSGDDLN